MADRDSYRPTIRMRKVYAEKYIQLAAGDIGGNMAYQHYLYKAADKKNHNGTISLFPKNTDHERLRKEQERDFTIGIL